MQVERICPVELVRSAQHRGISEDGVARLVESIQRIGMQTPPTIRYVVDEDTGEVSPVIVAGAHRVEACKRLGMPFIDVQVMEGDDVSARLWEISENLHRAELTPVERAEHIDEWRKLTAERVGNSPTLNKQPHERGVAKVARDLGVSRREVGRAATIAALPEETRQQAREEKWTATRLLETARPKREPIIAPDPRNDLEAVEAQVSRLMTAWNAAGREAREEFLRRVGE